MSLIIVPTDFSANADKACRYAISLAHDLKAKVILLHAYDTPVLYSNIPLVTDVMNESVLHNIAARKLKIYYEKIKNLTDGLKVELVTKPGLASARITELAAKRKADFIVMGTIGISGIEKVLAGSTTAKVISNATCMVLAVPPKAKYNGLQQIVYGTDLSNDNMNHSKNLFPIAKKFNSEIIYVEINNRFDEGEADDLKILKSQLQHLKYSKTSGYVCSALNITSGLDKFLKHHKADCLAVYTHHRNLLTSIFNRSIARALSFHTTIPLLVIHETDNSRTITHKPVNHKQDIKTKKDKPTGNLNKQFAEAI